jgi:hypothetical protein
MAHRDTVKPWFETGDKPTQAQFWQLFDFLRFLDDAIAIGDVTGLVNALLAKVNTADYEGQLITYDGQATYVIPAGYLLEKIIPFYGEAGYMNLSVDIMGDTDVAEIPEIAAGWNRPVVLEIFAENNTNLYIDGIPAGSKIVFLKRKIKME